MLGIAYSNKFNYKNKIGKFKYIDIKDLVNNIRNNTISKISANASLNVLNWIHLYTKYTSKLKELLNLQNDLLDTILTDKTLKSKSQKDKTLISWNEDNENDNDNENVNETMNRSNNDIKKGLNEKK